MIGRMERVYRPRWFKIRASLESITRSHMKNSSLRSIGETTPILFLGKLRQTPQPWTRFVLGGEHRGDVLIVGAPAEGSLQRSIVRLQPVHSGGRVERPEQG